jgi:hypothetical protein
MRDTEIQISIRKFLDFFSRDAASNSSNSTRPHTKKKRTGKNRRHEPIDGKRNNVACKNGQPPGAGALHRSARATCYCIVLNDRERHGSSSPSAYWLGSPTYGHTMKNEIKIRQNFIHSSPRGGEAGRGMRNLPVRPVWEHHLNSFGAELL